MDSSSELDYIDSISISLILPERDRELVPPDPIELVEAGYRSQKLNQRELSAYFKENCTFSNYTFSCGFKLDCQVFNSYLKGTPTNDQMYRRSLRRFYIEKEIASWWRHMVKWGSYVLLLEYDAVSKILPSLKWLTANPSILIIIICKVSDSTNIPEWCHWHPMLKEGINYTMILCLLLIRSITSTNVTDVVAGWTDAPYYSDGIGACGIRHLVFDPSVIHPGLFMAAMVGGDRHPIFELLESRYKKGILDNTCKLYSHLSREKISLDHLYYLDEFIGIGSRGPGIDPTLASDWKSSRAKEEGWCPAFSLYQNLIRGIARIGTLHPDIKILIRAAMEPSLEDTLKLRVLSKCPIIHQEGRLVNFHPHVQNILTSGHPPLIYADISNMDQNQLRYYFCSLSKMKSSDFCMHRSLRQMDFNAWLLGSTDCHPPSSRAVRIWLGILQKNERKRREASMTASISVSGIPVLSYDDARCGIPTFHGATNSPGGNLAPREENSTLRCSLLPHSPTI